MTTYYIDKINLPKAAQDIVLKIYEQFKNEPNYIKFDSMMRNGADFLELRRKIDSFAVENRINEYEFHLALLVTSLDYMHDQYKKIGLDEMFWDCVCDISFKVNECKNLYNIWGNEPFHWYQNFYEAKRLVFGRLQYDPVVFKYDDYLCEGVTVTKGDIVYYLHIPSSGKLLLNDIFDSLKAAYKFLNKDEEMIFFCCNSWMLYPEYKKKVFKEGSNLYSFVDLFEIINYGTTKEFADGWRVFNTEDFSDLDKLPQDTSLRRDFVNYLKNGGTYGYGMGIIAYDKTGQCNKKTYLKNRYGKE